MLKPSSRSNRQATPAFAVKRPQVDCCVRTLCGITIGRCCSSLPAQRITSIFTAAVMPVLIGPWSLA